MRDILEIYNLYIETFKKKYLEKYPDGPLADGDVVLYRVQGSHPEETVVKLDQIGIPYHSDAEGRHLFIRAEDLMTVAKINRHVLESRTAYALIFPEQQILKCAAEEAQPNVIRFADLAPTAAKLFIDYCGKIKPNLLIGVNFGDTATVTIPEALLTPTDREKLCEAYTKMLVAIKGVKNRTHELTDGQRYRAKILESRIFKNIHSSIIKNFRQAGMTENFPTSDYFEMYKSALADAVNALTDADFGLPSGGREPWMEIVAPMLSELSESFPIGKYGSMLELLTGCEITSAAELLERGA